MENTGLKNRIPDIITLFLKLGVTGFGGPAAHIAMMEEEVVGKRGWLDRERFLDLVGATNLIPGPNSTEMAIHVGYIHGGWAGLILAGASFILPAALITGGFAWAYVRFGSLPEVAPVVFGIKPAVLAVILSALWRLGRSAVKSWRLFVIGLAVGLASSLGVNEILALLSGGLIGMLWLRLPNRGTHIRILPLFLGLPAHIQVPNLGRIFHSHATSQVANPVSLWNLGWFFLRVGAVLYGSGYILVAFLEGGLVQQYGWLTQQQLLDAIAIGQFTPGPVLTTATFIGYLILGTPGAIIATLAIFAPSFVFVAVLNPIVPRLRRSPWTGAFLDAVNVSAVGLMAAVLLELGQGTLTTWPAWLIALLAAGLALFGRVNSTWLILGGALVGLLLPG